MENRIILKIIHLRSIMTAVNETMRAVNEQKTATAKCEFATSWLLSSILTPRPQKTSRENTLLFMVQQKEEFALYFVCTF